MTAAAPVGEVVRSSYLRFALEISDRGVKVTTPDGRRIGMVGSVSTARLLVRAYRREGRRAA